MLTENLAEKTFPLKFYVRGGIAQGVLAQAILPAPFQNHDSQATIAAFRGR